jgi:hypothetical protein
MKRPTFQDVESICAHENCRFNDLFLVGDAVFVMMDVENWRLPDQFRALQLDDSEVLSALPEILRRFDATEFQSIEQLQAKLAYSRAYVSEFQKLKYELYEVLTDASGERLPPDGGQFYLELDRTEGEDILLVCDSPESFPESLEQGIRQVLRDGNYSLEWRVRASFQSDPDRTRVIGKAAVVNAS